MLTHKKVRRDEAPQANVGTDADTIGETDSTAEEMGENS